MKLTKSGWSAKQRKAYNAWVRERRTARKAHSVAVHFVSRDGTLTPPNPNLATTPVQPSSLRDLHVTLDAFFMSRPLEEKMGAVQFMVGKK